MTSNGSALAGRIRTELDELKRVISRTEHLLAKAQQTDDDDYLDGVALNLHGFYAGIERIFEEIAREVDSSLPSGPDWHRNLLNQMSAEVANTRPPVIRRQTRACLDDYRGFRHIVRNVYTFNLRPSRLEELVNGLSDCQSLLSADISTFCEFLDALASGE